MNAFDWHWYLIAAPPRSKLALNITTFKLACCATVLLLFSWPAIYNGQPFFSPDTSAYVRGFDAGIFRLTGRSTVWTTWARDINSQNETVQTTGGGGTSFQSPAFVIAGRSVSYGALIYLGELFGGVWTTIAIQAALVLIALILTLKHFIQFTWLRLLVAASALAALSSLPFVTSFLLPDIFAGLAVLAAANLLAF